MIKLQAVLIQNSTAWQRRSVTDYYFCALLRKCSVHAGDVVPHHAIISSSISIYF
jgi:hypothetical protein